MSGFQKVSNWKSQAHFRGHTYIFLTLKSLQSQKLILSYDYYFLNGVKIFKILAFEVVLLTLFWILRALPYCYDGPLFLLRIDFSYCVCSGLENWNKIQIFLLYFSMKNTSNQHHPLTKSNEIEKKPKRLYRAPFIMHYNIKHVFLKMYFGKVTSYLKVDWQLKDWNFIQSS